MSKEYIEKTNAKRLAEGVTPLTAAGESQSDDSMDLCINKIAIEFRDLLEEHNIPTKNLRTDTGAPFRAARSLNLI